MIAKIQLMERTRTNNIQSLKTQFERRITAPRRNHLTTKTIHTFMTNDGDMSPTKISSPKVRSKLPLSLPRKLKSTTGILGTPIMDYMSKTNLEPIAETNKKLPKIDKAKSPQPKKGIKRPKRHISTSHTINYNLF
jgi:hypothetical protein